VSDPRRWILGSSWKDGAFIVLPGFAGITAALLLPPDPAYFMIYAFLASTVVNAGHVYTTAWRTLFRKEERESHPMYWTAPLAVAVGVSAWIYFKIPFLWSFVVYATAYHQIAQVYGFLKWYEKLNKKTSAAAGRFLIALTVMPFVLFHFRQLKNFGFYTDKDFFFYSSPELFKSGLAVYFLIIAAWLVFEAGLIRKKQFESNRFLAVLTPAALYGWCFLAGGNVPQILFPLFLSHGIPYLMATDLSLKRIGRTPANPAVKTGLIILVTAVIGGVATRLYGTYLIPISNDYAHSGAGLLTAVLTGLYLVPLLCHYIFDSHIWKSTHRDSNRIYSNS
jgi:hypothetical protein